MSRGPEPSYMVPITTDDGDAIVLVPALADFDARAEWLDRVERMTQDEPSRNPGEFDREVRR